MITPKAIFSFDPGMLAFAAGLIDIFERHGRVLVPIVAVLAVAILVAGVVSAWRTPEVAGAEKARVKGEIVRLLRNNLGWMTAQQVGAKVGLETHTAATMLQEMKRDGLVTSGTLEDQIHYRLKGV